MQVCPTGTLKPGQYQQASAMELWDTWAHQALGPDSWWPANTEAEQIRKQKELDKLEQRCVRMTQSACNRMEAFDKLCKTSQGELHLAQ